MARVYVSLGSNQGDSEACFQLAKDLLKTLRDTEITAESSLYLTEPWGKKDQPDFLNQVLELETALSPEDLLGKIQQIEKHGGRKRKVRWGPRTLDIDLLLYNQITVNKPDLLIPHSRMAERRFVLLPLAEIAPDRIVPDTGKTVACLLKECSDSGKVIKMSGSREHAGGSGYGGNILHRH